MCLSKINELLLITAEYPFSYSSEVCRLPIDIFSLFDGPMVRPILLDCARNYAFIFYCLSRHTFLSFFYFYFISLAKFADKDESIDGYLSPSLGGLTDFIKFITLDLSTLCSIIGWSLIAGKIDLFPLFESDFGASFVG
jgi:hypothetical protein